MCLENNLDVVDLIGLAPDMWKASFWKMLFSGKVGNDFKFRFTTSLKAGYSGYAIKHLS
jgi:hypothetical protein